jgi:hypothetical protein
MITREKDNKITKSENLNQLYQDYQDQIIFDIKIKFDFT